MAAVVRDFKYSKARGRGRGILGIRDFDLSRKPGTEASSQADSRKDGKGVLLTVISAKSCGLWIAGYTSMGDPRSCILRGLSHKWFFQLLGEGYLKHTQVL